MKTIIFDMYGVMLEESMGNFKPYTYNYFPNTDINLFRDKYIEAEAGVINSDQLFEVLGFDNPEYHMKNYIENHLTIDKGFIRFAEKYHGRYSFALISNGISQWHKHIMNYYEFKKYFEVEVVSADIGCRKPNFHIYEVLMDRLKVQASECFYIDNGIRNILTAKSMGIESILFNRDNKSYDGTTVYSFDELDKLISEFE